MRFLVVGCGSIGRRHLTNLVQMGAGQVLACDANPATLDAVTSGLGIPGFSDFKEALDQGPDVVMVCTPTHLHMPPALAALEAGAHLFIEKPLSSSLEGTDRLLKLAQQKQRTVLVGCNMRFHPGVAHLKRELDAGAIGEPLLFRAHFSHYLPNWRPGQDYRQTYSARRDQGGGIVMEGVHEIDYLRWLGGEIAEVKASRALLSDLEIETEDSALLLLRLAAGRLAEVHLDYLRPFKSRGCEVVGTDGILTWLSDGKAPERVRVSRYDPGDGRWKDIHRCDEYDGNQMYLEEMRHFLACIVGEATPMLDVAGARRVLEVALEAGGSDE